MGTLGSGERVSPSTVRRLACDAEILPVVLGTQGQVLDVGRAKRLFDGYVRRHTADWAVRLGSDGLAEFIPPAHVDTRRRSRRNQYHRRT